MSAHPELPLPADDDAFVREAEFKALRRLAKLTESENERVALRASEVLLRYAAQRRRDEAQTTSASGGRKPPEGAANGVGGAPSTRALRSESAAPSGGLRPPLAEVKVVPRVAPMG